MESKHKLSINPQIPWMREFEAAQITTDITKKQTQPRLHWTSVVTNNVARAGTGHWRTFVGWQSTTFSNSAGSKSGRLMTYNVANRLDVKKGNTFVDQEGLKKTTKLHTSLLLI